MFAWFEWMLFYDGKCRRFIDFEKMFLSEDQLYEDDTLRMLIISIQCVQYSVCLLLKLLSACFFVSALFIGTLQNNSQKKIPHIVS